MKKLLLAAALILVAFTAQAQCVAEVKDVGKGSKGQILVSIEFSFNGIKEPNIDIKTYYPEAFEGMVNTEKLDKLKSDAERTCDKIILYKYAKVNGFPLEEIRIDKVDAEIEKVRDFLIGKTISKYSVIINIDTNADSIEDKRVEINADGQKTITDITN